MHSKLISWSEITTTLSIKHLHEWVECLEDEIGGIDKCVVNSQVNFLNRVYIFSLLL